MVVCYALGLGRPDRFQNHVYVDKWEPGLRSRISSGSDLVFKSFDVLFLTENLTNCHANHLVQLCKYIVECKLFLWMVKLNCDKGIYPFIALLLVQAAKKSIPDLSPQHVRDKLKRLLYQHGLHYLSLGCQLHREMGYQAGCPPASEDKSCLPPLSIFRKFVEKV